ncbi:MAG: type II toxin-antitoxin system VapC family toxin [Akkermansiaceae bacterium]|nr:type II toxin-antitoxin system VapC family toxin [Akkermansiaceae bacterium]
MRTALDSSVVILLQRQQAGWKEWRETLTVAAGEGPLLISSVAFAECTTGYSSLELALERFAALQIRYDPLAPDAAYLAGQTFLRYRRSGGPRTHLIPDFLIAAHAQVQADRLAALDRGYFRPYFGELRLLQPAPGGQAGPAT